LTGFLSKFYDSVIINKLDGDDDHVDGATLRPELRPPTGLLFISLMIYEHGEPWWNDIDQGKLTIRPPELSGKPTNKSSSSKAGGTGE
jgi:hypothetical protein